MLNNQSPLNRRDREELMRFFEGQLNAGPKSSEMKQTTVQGKEDDAVRSIGGMYEGVRIDEYGAPQILSESRLKILDCGHALHNTSDLLGHCDAGHLICRRHDLRICDTCRKRIICELEWHQAADGTFECPDCKGDLYLGLLGLIIILTGVYYLVF